ncbi:glycosyltransferase [Pseudomonas sp.]|uniref:glycosyltransferase n=1 Tax=Pseudomonas sp. TaxID=306 RepID=UPI001A0E0405|nr:glycosyltransferase [Pseudomonas sp.]MBF0677174.1 glycosyltransferase [Pseudomonas sp.]
MKILVYSETTAETIKTNLGLPEYSYYFVLKEFLPALNELGEVVIVKNPEQEVDALYAQYQAKGESCVFLVFAPPHKTPIHFLCPTIPVFAWEFDSIPNEPWLNDPSQDWGYMLRQLGHAITHSEFTVATVHDLLGPQYPAISIPAPVWDRFNEIRSAAHRLPSPTHTVQFEGVMLDSLKIDLADYLYADPDKVHANTYGKFGQSVEAIEPTEQLTTAQSLTPPLAGRPDLSTWLRITLRYGIEWYRLVLRNSLPNALSRVLARLFRSVNRRKLTLPPNLSTVPAPTVSESIELNKSNPLSPSDHSIKLEGVVFTTVFNPYDGRKNWQDLLTAFCTALREKADATLIFKLTHREYHSAITAMLKCMAQLPDFNCRVLLIQGYLGDDDYKSLVHATSFVVNASYGEGQCLPLMEFLSCGKPAIAPRHSGMTDYINEDVAFVVDSWRDASAWPHDPRLACRTRRHHVSWEALTQAYAEAYLTFKEHPERYKYMSEQAISAMQVHCSRAAAVAKLEPLLRTASQAS